MCFTVTLAINVNSMGVVFISDLEKRSNNLDTFKKTLQR